MFSWINQSSQVLSVLINAGLLLVWIAYLQLFLRSYRRVRRAKILINRGVGHNLDARCLISNMSSEAIYIESIIACVESNDHRWSTAVTDVESLAKDDAPSDPIHLTRQGPLRPGDYVEIGSFRSLVDRVLREAGESTDCDLDTLDDLVSFEIQIAADYASEDLLVGAKRQFDLVKRDGRWLLQPHTLDTIQIRSRHERRQVRQMLEESL